MPTASVLAECLDDNVVADLVDGRLEGAALATAEAHLAACETCRTVVARVAGPSAASGGVDGYATTLSGDVEGEDVRLESGARVGRYEVIDVLGAGAMGTVYAARDPSLDRKVALKLIRAKAAGPDLEARLLREAQAMARLSHPEVIAVYDVGKHGDRLFIAMELVDGGTLREWLEAAPRTSREILAVYLRAGRGLAQAHAAGIVHRDFKPDNVLVGKDGRVRVTDFGLARDAQRDEPVDAKPAVNETATVEAALTRTGAVVGTPVYMAPEQLRGQVADVRSDVYGFCVALYEALYGERPFEGRTLNALIASKAASNVRPPPPNSKVSQRVRRALLAGLRAKPEERYASMNAALDALERAAKASKVSVVAGVSVVALATVVALLAKPWAHTPPIAASSASSATPAAMGAKCTSHRACVESHDGAPYLCRASDKTCVPITSEDCSPKFEPDDLLADDTIWLGAMFPTTGPAAAAYGTMNMEGVEFARKEIAGATRALDGPNASLRVPRIALVACDDAVDPMRAAKHLVDDVGVPAILGFGTGQKLVDVAGSLLISRGVLSIATTTPSPLVTRLPQPAELPRMVWRTNVSVEGVASATAHMLHDVLEPRLVSRSRPTRVTFAREDTASGLAFAEVLTKELVFNAKPALQNGDDYKEVTLGSGALPASDVARVAQRVLDAAPTIVVMTNTSLVPLLEAIEAAWPRTTPRPTYVIANNSLADFSSFLGTNVDRRRRLFGVLSSSSSPENARFVLRYNEAHTEKVTLTFNGSPSYDAFYLLAYAAFALRNEPVTGPALARAFARLVPPADAVEVGPTSVFGAITRLAAGGKIDLQGAATALDFSLSTGEVACDFALLCAGVDGGGRATRDDVESGVVFHESTRRIVGTPRCP